MKKIVAVLLAGILIFGQSFSAMEVRAQESAEGSQKDKTETVYVKADAEGNVQDISVETVLKNRNNGEELPDYSNLSDIKNMVGDEEFTQDSDGKILWENNGEDISYKGKSSESLPVSVKISYYLDGEKVAPEEIAGKSGSIRIRFDYKNHTSEIVTVGGKTVDVQTPFVLLSVMFLPSDTFSNIKVTNGKVMTSGDDNIVIGYASPGLADSLKLESYGPTEDISIPEYVEVTAEASEFELGFTATVVTPGAFADMDTEDLKDVDELIDDMDTLTDASSQLVTGTSEFLSGMKTFETYMAEYIKGVTAVKDGSDALTEGLAALNENKEALQSGAEALQSGLESLNGALAQISLPTGAGTGQGGSAAGEASQAAVSEAAKALAADGEKLAGFLVSIQESIVQMQTFTESAAAYFTTVQENVGAAQSNLSSVNLSDAEAAANAKAKEQAGSALDTALTSIPDEQLSVEEKARIRAAAVDGIDVSGTSSVAQGYVAAAAAELTEIPAFEVPKLSVDANGIEDIVSDMTAKLGILESYSENLSGMAESISAMGGTLETLKSSVSQLAGGSKQLTEGITAFNDGISQLYEGASALSSGASELTTAGESLNTGLGTLTQGAQALNEGGSAFDEEGIKSLGELAGSDLENLLTRIRALKEADSRYNNFAGIRENQTGSVKFIIETEEIEK